MIKMIHIQEIDVPNQRFKINGEWFDEDRALKIMGYSKYRKLGC